MTYKWWSPLYFKLFCLFHAITKPCDRNKNDIYMCYNWGFTISTIFKYSFLLFCSFTGSSVGNWLSMTWQLFSLWKLESAVSCTVKTLITKSQRWAMLFRCKGYSLYPSIIQQIIKSRGIKITLLYASIYYRRVCSNGVLLLLKNSIF